MALVSLREFHSSSCSCEQCGGNRGPAIAPGRDTLDSSDAPLVARGLSDTEWQMRQIDGGAGPEDPKQRAVRLVFWTLFRKAAGDDAYFREAYERAAEARGDHQ